jgi:hypothetical protein
MSGVLRSALLLGAVLALVAASGCGGDTKSSNDYVESLNKVQTDFADSVQKTSAPSSGSSTDQAQAVFDNLDEAIDKLISDLKGVEPPDKVKDLHNDLITEMTQFQAQVKTAGAALKSGDPTKIVAAQKQFAADASTLGTKIGQTIQGINDKLQD